jgi:hypothetical protein
LILNLWKSLRKFIEEEPHSYRDEMVEFILEKFNIEVSLATISRTLKRERISRKKVFPLFNFSYSKLQRIAKERSAFLRAEWMQCLGEWQADQLVFLDESAINERSLDRKHGWAPIGQFARLVTSIKRTEKWSILPLYTIDGFLTAEIIKGSYNSLLFKRYMREIVIPNCTPYPGPRSVVVMDNARIHCDPVISSLFFVNI